MMDNCYALHGMQIIPARYIRKEAIVWRGGDRDPDAPEPPNKITPLGLSKTPPTLKGGIVVGSGEDDLAARRDPVC